MKRVLFLCTADPLGVGGGEFATRSYLKAICEIAGGNVDLLITDDWSNNIRQQFKLKNIYVACERSRNQKLVQYVKLIIDRFAQRAMQVIEENNDEYSCVVVNGSILAGELSGYLKKKRLPLVAIYHNYEPEFYKDNFKGLKKFLFLPVVKILERRAYRNSCCNLFLSNQDMNRFESVYGSTSAKNSLLGVFEYDELKYNSSPYLKRDLITFVITGSLNNAQGVDGVLYFVDELYKSIPPHSHVIIAGKNPTVVVKEICSRYPNIELIPSPKNIQEVILRGDIYICPTRLGGGVKLRVMDGLRLGLPVVTHECSARGYDLFMKSPSFEVFKTAAEFSDSINRIITLFENKKVDRRAVYNQYVEVFAFKAGAKRMETAIREFLR